MATASEIIINANTRADSAIADAQGFMDRLGEISIDDTIVPPADKVEATSYNSSLRTDIAITAPESIAEADPDRLEDLVATEIDDLTKPEITYTTEYGDADLPAIWDDPVYPEFTDQPQDITAPDVPTTEIPDKPDLYEVTRPDVEIWAEKDLPDPLVLNNITIDKLDQLEISDVDLNVPLLNLTSPTNTFEYTEAEYSTGLLTSLQTLLQTDVEEGGYGIEPTDEQEIYDRARERNARQAAAEVDRVRKGVASRGFPVPPGTLFAAEQVALREGAVNLAELNREIVLKRSDLYVQARQFAVQQGLNLEQALFTFVGAKQERALKAQQVAMNLRLEFHNASVNLFQLEIELKKLYRDLHAEQLKAAAMKIQEYEQELAYTKAEDDKDRLRLTGKEQELKIIETFYNHQQALDEHTKLEIEIERLMLEENKHEIDNYITGVRAYAEEYNGYRTAWQAEETKQGVFVQQLAAHDRQVETELKIKKAAQERFSADLELLRVKKEKYAEMVAHYGREVDRIKETFAQQQKINDEIIELWKANRNTERTNKDNIYRYGIDNANKILEEVKTNQDQFNNFVNAIMGMKELNSTAAVSAVQLYQERVKTAQEGLSSIAAVIESA